MSFSNAFAANYFENLVGCYKTLEWNGTPVDVQDSVNLSKIKKGDALATLNMDYTTMPAFEMALFQQATADEHRFGYASPFINKGRHKEKNGKHTYHFSGLVRYRSQPELSSHLQHVVEVRKLKNGNIWIKNFRQVAKTNEFDVDETYLLKPIACTPN